MVGQAMEDALQNTSHSECQVDVSGLSNMNIQDALVVSGNKVLVELEWEQIDAIVRQELREHITMIHRDIRGESWVHEDDKKVNEILFPAMLAVYEYYSGKEETNKLKEQLNETLRSAE